MAAWRPHKHTLALLEQVQAVLDEYAAYLPLTLRQVFYRLVGVYAYDKTEQAYERLGEALNRARRAGLVAWDTIRDDGFQLHAPTAWDSPDELARAFVNGLRRFRLDRQRGQSTRLVIAVEAAGMLPQVQAVADEYGVPSYAAGGFDSSTAKYRLAEYMSGFPRVELLHVGDHDPSGVHLFRNLSEDVTGFADGGDLKFTRLAVTIDQIAQFGLPTAPPKPTDRRSFTGETVQAEALPPDQLAEIVRAGIENRIDREQLAATLDAERAIQSMSRAEIARLILQMSDD